MTKAAKTKCDKEIAEIIVDLAFIKTRLIPLEMYETSGLLDTTLEKAGWEFAGLMREKVK